MSSTIAILVTGVFLGTTGLSAVQEQPEFTMSIENTVEVENNIVSYAVSIDTPEEELELIKSAAEEAGMGFTYKKRGVKTRLVIDMVIETDDDYYMERVTVKEGDGEKQVQWMTDEEGMAISFIDEETLEFTKAIQ